MVKMPCPCCTAPCVLYAPGTTTAQAYFAQSTYSISNGRGRELLDVWSCKACGHGFTPVTKVDEAHILRWYASSPKDETYMHEKAGRRKTARTILHRLAHIVDAPGKALDIGAGPGFFVEEAVQAGWDAEGLEAAEWAVTEYARRTGAARIRHGTTDALATYPPSTYDLVTAFDVIEHLADPFTFVTRCAKLLAPGGILVLTTPRFDSLAAKLLGSRWHCMIPAHLHYFSRCSLQAALHGAGLTILRTRHHTRYFSFAYLLQFFRRYVRARFGGKAEMSDEKPGSPSTGLLLPINLRDEWEVYAVKG